MHLRVENLGPLREADVDLRPPLVVLTGPNNTGKTWFAWTTYALLRELARTPAALPEGAVLSEEHPTLELDLATCAAVATSMARVAAERVTERLPDVFAASRVFFDETRLHLHVRTDVLQGQASVRWMSPGARVRGAFEGEGRGVVLRLEGNAERPPGGADEVTARAASLAAYVLGRLCAHAFGFDAQPTLFPAERIAVNLFARELAASRTELVEEALSADAAGRDASTILRRAGRFPMPLRETLSAALRLDASRTRESPHADLADELERLLLHGTIRANAQGELEFAPTTRAVSLPLHMTSSIVKSLASLTFYFRHLAGDGDVLIIDEPELNLHPDAQRVVARFLAKLVRRGFRLIVSTHSDFVVRELGHLVMLGSAREKGAGLARDLGYEPDALLTPEDLGVWLFEHGNASRVPVTEMGFGVRTIDDEIQRMNVDSQRIFAVLGE